MTGVGSVELSRLARDLHRMGPEIRRRMKADFERAGQGARSDARSRAGTWSRRIPAAISLRSFADPGRGRVGVELRVGTRNAPHARPYEGIGGGSYFRHPVFGRRTQWVAQATRPYALPAVRGRAPQVSAAVADTVEAAAREAGFR